MGSGQRVTWGLGQSAHVSGVGGGDRGRRRGAVRWRKDARGLPALWGRGGAGWGLRTGMDGLWRGPWEETESAISESLAGGVGGGVLLRV